MDTLIYVFGAGILAVLFAAYLAWDVLRRDKGTPAMQEISDMIYQGAMAFLKRQYRTIAILALVTSVIMGVVIGVVENNSDLGVKTGIAFIVGAFCSALAGFIGMYISVKSNIRTASAARRSLSEAITVSLRGGGVSGFLVVAMSLLGVAAMFTAYGGVNDPTYAVLNIVGFGFGASFVALFAQLGGGIYTKAADVGADLVGKVEAGIPEDDPRNAAVIADLVGDNVGDCAGRGADLFESTAAENIGAMILGLAIYATTKNPAWIFFPLVVRAAGIVASIIGLLSVRGQESGNPMRSLIIGYWVTAIASIIGVTLIAKGMLGSYWFAVAGIVGIVTSLAIVYITEYYTGEHRPVKGIAEASRTGPATNIISGTAVGFECTGLTAVAIGLALILSYWAGSQAANGSGLFGTAVATMGMLMTCAFVLAMDTFGPITDNAGGITEMSGQPENVRRITDSLDAVGNTTKALTKGYAIGSAALAAFLLFSAYIAKVQSVQCSSANVSAANCNAAGMAQWVAQGHAFLTAVDLSNVEVFVGALLSVMLVFLFSSLAIRAVGRAASSIIEEVRRQFKENPLIMEGKAKPDYARCVDITTAAALREMVLPGVLAVGLPIVVGLVLKAEAMAGFLMVGTIAGIMLATVLNNGGGAWDNAKKFIEAGNLVSDGGEVIGKRTPTHAAAVVGDTVGDPFKDTAGPSLHVLVKLLSTITLVLAPLFVIK